jgi:hypothetical protein
MGPNWDPDTKMNWPTDHRSQYNLTWTCVIALQITDASSHQRGHLHEEESNCHSKKYLVTRSKRGPTPRWTVRLTVGCNITWTWNYLLCYTLQPWRWRQHVPPKVTIEVTYKEGRQFVQPHYHLRNAFRSVQKGENEHRNRGDFLVTLLYREEKGRC